MRILLITPLYPPEVADAAVYAKELARRLSKNHKVTVLAYAHLPEKLPGVRTIIIEKNQTRATRLWAFQHALAREIRDTDVVVAVNGASVELPIFLTRHVTPLIFCVADKTAHERGGILERLASLRARSIIRNVPDPKPEILPLEPEPTEALAAWDAAWSTHVHALEGVLNHGH